MCGFYGTTLRYSSETYIKKLELMNFRGPDFQAVKDYDTIDGKHVTSGHVRLAIMDLDSRSNVFDKLFPQDYFPKTFLRKMCGFYYDKAYQPLSITEEKLLCCLNDSPTDRIIIKPSVDGMSGRCVEAFIRMGEVKITG